MIGDASHFDFSIKMFALGGIEFLHLIYKVDNRYDKQNSCNFIFKRTFATHCAHFVGFFFNSVYYGDLRSL